MFLFDQTTTTIKKIFSNNDPHRVDELPYTSINKIICKDEYIFICSNEGLGVLRKRFFESPDALTFGNTIGMTPSNDGGIYVNFGDIFNVLPNAYGFEGKLLPSLNMGSISFVSNAPGKLWAGSVNGELFQIGANGRVKNLRDLKWRGQSVFSILTDTGNRTWFCQAPSETPIIGVGCVLSNGQLKFYDETHGFENRLLVIKESPQGRIYAAGIGQNSYLYRYLPEEDRFMNLSLRPDFPLSLNFEVHDITIDQKGIIWMGTTDGLLVYDTDRVSLYDLGKEYEGIEIRAVASMPDGSIWASTDTKGLLYINNGKVLNFGEKSGLPTKIMAYRSLLVDPLNRLWVGTAEGLVYSYSINPVPELTLRPWITDITSDKDRSLTQELTYVQDQKISIDVKSPCYNGYGINYEYKIDDSPWYETPPKIQLNTSDYDFGNHSIAIRAKSEGGFLWSESVHRNFEVKRIWYQRPIWQIFLSGLLLLGLVLIFGLLRKRYQKRIQKLAMELKNSQEEVKEKDSTLVQVQTALAEDEEELKATAKAMEIIQALILKIQPGLKWDLVLEHLSIELMKIPGITAFEIARKAGRTIEFEGFSNLTKSFTGFAKEDDPLTCLASYSIQNKKTVILKDVENEIVPLLKSAEERVQVYKSVIGVPYYHQQSQPAALFLYSTNEDQFDEYKVRVVQILAAYLEQIS